MTDRTDVEHYEDLMLFGHAEAAQRFAVLAGLCTCHVGMGRCVLHPGRVRGRSQEEKIAFRKAWDARVDARRTDA